MAWSMSVVAGGLPDYRPSTVAKAMVDASGRQISTISPARRFFRSQYHAIQMQIS